MCESLIARTSDTLERVSNPSPIAFEPAVHRHEVHRYAGFVEAARRWAATMLVLSEQDRAVDGIFKDAGRFVAAMYAVSMREEGGYPCQTQGALCAVWTFKCGTRPRRPLVFALPWLCRCLGAEERERHEIL